MHQSFVIEAVEKSDIACVCDNWRRVIPYSGLGLRFYVGHGLTLLLFVYLTISRWKDKWLGIALLNLLIGTAMGRFPPWDLASALTYHTSQNRWQRLKSWEPGSYFRQRISIHRLNFLIVNMSCCSSDMVILLSNYWFPTSPALTRSQIAVQRWFYSISNCLSDPRTDGLEEEIRIKEICFICWLHTFPMGSPTVGPKVCPTIPEPIAIPICDPIDTPICSAWPLILCPCLFSIAFDCVSCIVKNFPFESVRGPDNAGWSIGKL